MESRKYQLQQQIIEAQKANDDDLVILLKSQWAHRYGVESLEELKNLYSSEVNENFLNEDNQKIDQSGGGSFENEKSISIKGNDTQATQIKNDTKKVFDSVEIERKESFEIKSYEVIDKQNFENKSLIQSKEYKNQPKISALIPIPPKPKYSYLKKWLVRS